MCFNKRGANTINFKTFEGIPRPKKRFTDIRFVMSVAFMNIMWNREETAKEPPLPPKCHLPYFYFKNLHIL